MGAHGLHPIAATHGWGSTAMEGKYREVTPDRPRRSPSNFKPVWLCCPYCSPELLAIQRCRGLRVPTLAPRGPLCPL